ncbi:MAG: hypothetical protein ACK504_01840 [Bacteroidota bacterium]
MSGAPTQYPLEVVGGIGLNFGDFIGVRMPSVNINERRILQTGWDNVVGDFLTFFTPGASGTINGREKMRITNGGCVAIGGDANPLAKIQVTENGVLGSTSNSSNHLLASFQSNVDGGNRFKSNLWVVRDKIYSNTNDWQSAKLHDGISIDGVFLNPGSDTKTWWERFPIQDVQSWGNAATTHMKLYQGRLILNNPGIPAARIDIKETDGAYISLLARAYHSYDYGYAIRANVTRDNTKAYAVLQESYGNIANNAKETFVVYGNGTTRIGTKYISQGIHNNALLSVDGKLVAKEIIVTVADWSDFVFDRGYKLRPLSEVESYYKENHHLPEVPTTKEIVENGNDLGKTDAILLQKIEELTMYIVELQKQIDTLKTQVKK